MFIPDPTHYVMKMLGHVCITRYFRSINNEIISLRCFVLYSPQHRQSFQDLLAGVGDPRDRGRSDRLLTRVGDVREVPPHRGTALG